MSEMLYGGLGALAVAGVLEAMETALTVSYGLLPEVLYVVGGVTAVIGLAIAAKKELAKK